MWFFAEGGEWDAELLTKDHKPECNDELARIMNSGGKVVKKSGIPRVVWNRPKIGHKGPVRRSTQIDEIPFLAVARSLGDLWSYNSELNEFVVSPEPDVRVIEINPKTFRCLIFGTDGLWNVMRPDLAVQTVKIAEASNEMDLSYGVVKEWRNPSKCLVDEALNRWSIYRARADNTSVVTIMLDPPGPPKRDVLKASATTIDYGVSISQETSHGNTEQLHRQVNGLEQQMEMDKNNTIYHHQQQQQHSDDIDHIPLPTNGISMMTRYEEEPSVSNNYDLASATGQSHNENIMYMSSFAESYNSLLNSNMGYTETSTPGTSSDSSASYNTTVSSEPEFLHYSDDTYSITDLETRINHNQTSTTTSVSYHDIDGNYNMERFNYLDYSHVACIDEDHDYVFPVSQPSPSETISTFSLQTNDSEQTLIGNQQQEEVEDNTLINPDIPECYPITPDSSCTDKSDATIQINVISSSFNENIQETDTLAPTKECVDKNLNGKKVKKEMKSSSDKGSSTKIGLRSNFIISNNNVADSRSLNNNRNCSNTKNKLKNSENSSKKISKDVVGKKLTTATVITRGNTTLSNKNSVQSVMDMTLRALRSRNTISSTLVSTTSPITKQIATITQPKISNNNRNTVKAKKTIERIMARARNNRSHAVLRKTSAGPSTTIDTNRLTLLNRKSKQIMKGTVKTNNLDINKQIMTKRLSLRNNIWKADIPSRNRRVQKFISG